MFNYLIELCNRETNNKKYKRNDGKFVFCFPIKANNSSVSSTLEDLYEKYDLLLKEEINKQLELGNEEFRLNDSEIKAIKERGNTIITVLKQYLSGDLYKAYETFKDMMDECISKFPVKEVEPNTPFYRMRKGNCTKQEDFYHLPTNLRRKFCSSERFSIAGYPCFYIGYSKKDCIKEICKTDSVSASDEYSIIELKLKADKSTDKVLDLTFYKDQENQTGLKNFLLAFPIIASCYVVVEDNETDVKFREEYIIPQMLTSYLKKEQIDDKPYDGICYYTVRNENLSPLFENKEDDYRNLVLFTKLKSNKKYDKNLMDKFEWDETSIIRPIIEFQ